MQGWGNNGWGSNWGDAFMGFVQADVVNHGAPSLPNVAAGDLLIGVVFWAGVPGAAPVDNLGNTWVAATKPWGGTPWGQVLNPFVQLYYALNAIGGDTQLTFASDNGVMQSYLVEYSGLTKYVASVGNAGWGGQNSFLTPMINTKPNDFLFTVATGNGTSITPSNGFTRRASGTIPMSVIADSTSIGGNYYSNFNARNVDSYAILMASFRP